MLSSEEPSGPSCSSKSFTQGVTADPATSPGEATPACQDQDPTDLVQPLPKFSIRDYVFASRSKGIKRSWPFNPRSLQLCLKRGVKDLLPPFEPPDLIRTQSLNTSTNAEQSAACSEANAPVGLVKTKDDGSSNVNASNISFQSCQPVTESLGPSQYTSPEDGKSALDQGENTDRLDHTDEIIPVDLQVNSCTEAIRQTEVVVPSWRSKNLDSSREPSEKKCKLVVKLGSLTRTEEVASNSSAVSDPMASKTCPVCKVFASTSNTTLNAHMDQCLSVESNTELVETVVLKPKVKPRKKLLMVDIYRTARVFTLEDLDRRNGTNWAVDLAMPTRNKDVCTENCSPEVVSFEPRDDEREGDVYVDSNGIKIRILSKSSDASLVLRDEHNSRKVTKNETGKGILMNKTCLKSKICKNKRFKIPGKKHSKLNRLNTQVRARPDGDIHDHTSEEEEEESAMHVQKPIESTSYGGSEIIRQWVGSKRSGLTKNCARKLTDKASKSITPGTKKLARNSMHGFDDSQTSDSLPEAFSSQPPEEMATTSEANDDDQRNGSPRLLRSIPKWSSKTTPTSSVRSKVPRSAAALANRKIKEIGRREAYRSDNYDTARNSTSIRSSVRRGPSSVAGLSDGSNSVASTSKIRKNRSLLRTGRREFSPSNSELVHGFGQDHGSNPNHLSKKIRVSNKETAKKLKKHTEEDTVDNNFSYGSDTPALGQGDDQYDVAQQAGSAQMYYEGEEPETEMQCASASRSNPVDCSNEMTSDSLSPENNETADDVLAESYSAAMVDPCSNEKSAHHAHVPTIVVNNDVEEWQIDPSSTKESSACLTNNRDMGLGAPQDNSSITSNREDSILDHGLVFDRGSSGSPISTASTISPSTSLRDSRINRSEPGPSTVNFTTVEERVSGSSNQETNSTTLAREGEQLPEKPCCCTCRESISKESQVHHQSETVRSVPTFSGRQVPQLNIGLRASSSFSTYQRTSTKANPCLDSHDQTLAGKVSAEPIMTHPSYTTDCMSPTIQTQLPSPSNPVLRLMGKNLMVMNSEESGHSQAPSSDYIVRENYMAPGCFVPQNYQHFGDPAFMNTTPSAPNHQIPLSSVQAGNFAGPPLHSGSMVQSDYHSPQKPYRNLVPVMHHPSYMMKEVIMINDSPENRSNQQVSMLLPSAPSPATTIPVPNTMASRPFYCLPSQNQLLPRESAVGPLPVFANINPMVGVSSQSQGNNAEVAHPYINPFYMQSSAGYINPSVYYSQNLR
uniref:UBZ4-type domain-containing protein n=1 Tax=Leersia perrieri TaxID=77586 RepID=A0A0D9W646_9ORYZ